jgi:two-component system response regulator HydG
MCELLAAHLSSAGFEVIWRSTGAAALDAFRATDIDAVLTDLDMAGMGGFELCTRIRSEDPDVAVVLLTAHGSFENAVAALRATIYDVLTKPPDVEAMIRVLDRAVQHRRLQGEVRRLRKAVATANGFGEMVGTSAAMHRVFDLLARVAESDASVLITGETGTGKELVARALHHQGRRRRGPFVVVNCAAMPNALLESELFGHARGAFTDARAARTGLFQQAHRGTLFLDEIGELALELQPKLLRVLQDHRVRPVGADTEVACDVRLIAATNRPLDAEVTGGRFREDLYFRINVITVEVPPLRERDHDVLLLAQHFVDRYATRASKRVVGFSSQAAERLLAYSWPGNVRELQNCVERAVALCTKEHVSITDLPDALLQDRHKRLRPEGGAEGMVSLETVECRHIVKILDAVQGNRTRAAEVLGIDQKTLRRKLDRIGRGDAD